MCYLRKGETKDAKWKRTQGPLHAEAFPVLQDSADSAERPNGLMFVKPHDGSRKGFRSSGIRGLGIESLLESLRLGV